MGLLISVKRNAKVRARNAAAFIAVAMFLLLYGVGLAAESPEKKTLTRRVDPIEIDAKYFKPLLGKQIDKFRVMARQGDTWRLLIFEIDERYPNLDYYFQLGPDADYDKANHILDPQDQVVFYVNELGDRAPRNTWPAEVTDGVEITLTDPINNSRGWAYLFYYADKAPDIRPERFGRLEKWNVFDSPKEGFQTRGSTCAIDGAVNKVGKRYYKTPFNKNFRMLKSAGGTEVNILDRQKCRFECRLLFGAIKIGFNESNAIGGISALGTGPARGYGRMWSSITLPVVGIEGPKGYVDVMCYATMIVVPNFLHVPMNPGNVITDATLSVGYDFNQNAYGMKFYNSNNLEGFTVDGKMDEKEKRMNTALDTWRCITGPQGTMITRSDWDPEFTKQADISVVFEDDIQAIDNPEDIPGKIGYFHNVCKIKSLQSGTYVSQLDWYYPDHFYDPKGLRLDIIQEYLNIKGKPIKISVLGQTFNNTAGKPSLLKPSKMKR